MVFRVTILKPFKVVMTRRLVLYGNINLHIYRIFLIILNAHLHTLQYYRLGLELLSESGFNPRFDPDPIRKSGYLERPNPDPNSKMLDPSKPNPDILIF